MIRKLLNSKHKYIFVFLIFPWVIVSVTRAPIDFGIFSDTVHGWLSGQFQLYHGQTEFYFAPWTIIPLIPFVILPPPLGQILYTTVILTALVWATWTLTKPTPWWAMSFALLNLYTALLIFNGQWDSVILASLALGWIAIEGNNPWLLGLALVGLSTKPTNSIIPTILLLYMLRTWSKSKLMKSTTFPLLAAISSVFIAGVNWPIQYIYNLRDHPSPPNYVVVTPWTNTLFLRSYWEYLNSLGQFFLGVLLIFAIVLFFRILRRGIDRRALAVALAINIVASPHAILYSFILLAPIHTMIFTERRGLGLLLTVAAFIDMIFIWIGLGVYIYPLMTLLVIMIIELMNHPIRPAILPSDKVAWVI
jgi:hypothetical protein